MLRTFCLIAALAAISSPAWAENNGNAPHNAAEQRACEADAHRFCQQEIPDEFRVASCLQAHRHRLSRACRTALRGHK